MPQHVGGTDPINTETEYAGKVPMPNTVGDLGPNVRQLEPHEKLRLGRLTGQDEDPNAPREPGFMGGVDSNFPEHDNMDLPPSDYRSSDYLVSPEERMAQTAARLREVLRKLGG